MRLNKRGKKVKLFIWIINFISIGCEKMWFYNFRWKRDGVVGSCEFNGVNWM